jgi:DNA-binding beta-propeller fold protein YncE
MLSNRRHSVTVHNIQSSVAFSNNGTFLYVTDLFHIYQYDLSYSVLDSGKLTVAIWDSTYDPLGPPFATYFWICRLAPDHKIYISTGNGTIYLHVINSPDNAGLACDVRQHALTLPTYNFNSIPYFPNYSLSQITGSICDSLTLSSTDHSPPLYEKEINVFPNPAERVLYVSVAGHKPFQSMAIFNSLGTEMSCNTTLLKHDEYIEFNISNLIPGVYFIELSGEKEKVVRRFVKL